MATSSGGGGGGGGAAQGICCIFFAEFHVTVGPTLVHQAPAGYLLDTDFAAVSDYMITKPDLSGSVITLVHPSVSVPVDDWEASLGGGGDSSTPSPVPPHDPSSHAHGSSPPDTTLLYDEDGVQAAVRSRVRAVHPSEVEGVAEGGSGGGGGGGGFRTARARTPVKFVSFPVGLEHDKYFRNSLLYTLGFVLPVDADTRAYEPALRKLGLYLYSLEIESEFLSKPEKKATLASILPAILHGLNTRGECFVAVDACDTIALKLFPILAHPPVVRDNHVPVRLRDLDVLVGSGDSSGWDLCMRALLPLIDGKNYVRAIAEEADMDLSLVRRVCQHLLYYGCITMVDIFQYSNIYATQPRVQLLLRSSQLREACLQYITAEDAGGVHTSPSLASLPVPAPPAPVPVPAAPAPAPAPAPVPEVMLRSHSQASSLSVSSTTETAPLNFDVVFRLYSAFGAGSRTCDVCVQGETARYGVNDRRLITFGVMHGILQRLHQYPVPTGAPMPAGGGDAGSAGSASGSSGAVAPRLSDEVLALLDGTRNLEELCCRLHCTQETLERAIEAHGGFVYVLK